MVLVHSKQAKNQMLINIIIAPRILMIASQFYQNDFLYNYEILSRTFHDTGPRSVKRRHQNNWNMELKFFLQTGPHYVMTHERKLEVIYMMLLLIAYFYTVNATWIEAIRGVISDSKIF